MVEIKCRGTAGVLAIYTVWVVIQSCGNAFAMFLNGAGIIKQQAVAVLLFVIIALPLKIFMTDYFDLFGLVVVTVVAYVVSHFFTYCYLYFNEIKNILQPRQ